MFTRPSDVLEPLPSIRNDERVATLHREWARTPIPQAVQTTAPWHRFTRLARRIANRAPGSLDREMIGHLIRAVDAVAARCDEIADRLAHQQIVLNDAVTIFGEELTRLRADSAPFARGEHQPSPPSPVHDE